MLLHSDKAALHGSRFLPNGSNAVARVAGIRAATLDTATYGIYGASGTPVELLGSTFQTGIVQAGNQVRFEVFGHMSDTVGANQLVVRINVTQQATQIPVVLTANTQALDVAFRIQGAVSFSQPGAAGRGVVSPQGATSKNEASYFGGASDSLIVGAFIRFEQTDAFASTTLRIGGNVLADNAASPSTGLSQLVTNKDQNTTLLLGGQPVGISLATVVPANTTLTVQGGWMDCL